jgi:hypothetical protein
MELAVWKGLESTPIVRVKDWRHGRLKLRRPFDAPDSEYGDMLTIFRSWAERLRGALVDLSAKSSAPASR